MLFLLSLASLLSSAQAADLCAQGPCNAAQQAIQTLYNQHPGFSDKSSGGVFSGSCYHQWPNIDPDHEQYGISVIDSLKGGLGFQALFSFYDPQNPYANLSYADAEKLLASEGAGDKPPIDIGATDGHVLLPSSEGNIEYWLRSDGQDFFLLGFFGLKSGQGRTWCHFTRNK